MKRVKKLFALLLALAVVVSGQLLSPEYGTAAAKTATPSNSSVQINGKTVPFQAYNIDGSNYFKLRDIAMALSGTQKQFGITYSSSANAMYLVAGQAYTPIGGELKVSANLNNVSANPTTTSVYLNNVKLTLSAYNIAGSNYFKLRELGSEINFSVGWDSTANAIGIDTSKDYGPMLVFMSYMFIPDMQAVSSQLKTHALNNGYRYTEVDVTYQDIVQLVQTYCDQRVAGLFVSADASVADKVVPICKQSGTALLTLQTDYVSGTSGKLLTAGVNSDPYRAGSLCAQWMIDNCSNYGMSVTDDSKLGFVIVTNSQIKSLAAFTTGASETAGSAYPNCRVIIADSSKQKEAFNATGVAAAVTEVLKANTDIKQWFVVSAGDYFVEGAVNAIKAAGLEGKTIVTAGGDSYIRDKWLSSNYDGCFKACCYSSMKDIADSSFGAMDAVLKGSTTMEQLFADEKQPGETYAIHQVDIVMLDKQAYLKMMGS